MIVYLALSKGADSMTDVKKISIGWSPIGAYSAIKCKPLTRSNTARVRHNRDAQTPGSKLERITRQVHKDAFAMIHEVSLMKSGTSPGR